MTYSSLAKFFAKEIVCHGNWRSNDRSDVCHTVTGGELGLYNTELNMHTACKENNKIKSLSTLVIGGLWIVQ